MAHHVRRVGRWLVEELDVLVIVDLDEGDADVLAVLFRKRIGLIVSKEVVPEGNRLRKVGHKVPDVRDTCNLRTRRSCLLRAAVRRGEQENGRQTAQGGNVELLDAHPGFLPFGRSSSSRKLIRGR